MPQSTQLEHLENVFYKQGISTMPESMFLDAGFTSAYYNNLKYVAHDEESHVVLLTSALSAAGITPVAACEYSFPFTDPKSFVTLASILEGVGSAAYLGAAPAISDKAYLAVAGAILDLEAIHASLQRFAIGKVAPANPYGSAIIPNAAYTLAAAFITSCPSSNAPLPFSAFPALTATQGEPTSPGLAFTFSSSPLPTGTFYVTFVSGMVTVSMAASVQEGMIETIVPVTASGQTYAFVTSANVTAVTDAVVLFGPAILEVTPNSPTFDLTIM
jgi:hypothetical protein